MTLDLFTSLSRNADHKHKLVVGPWSHLMPFADPTSKIGSVDFGNEAKVNLHERQLKWFDFYLKGIENGVTKESPIELFIMGANKFRNEVEWPLLRIKSNKIFITSSGHANTLNGDGQLTYTQPNNETESFDTYDYDPLNPVPTNGGNPIGLPVENVLRMGPHDQIKIEHRDDVLVYTSQPLENNLEVTGTVFIELYASSSAVDTDFTAKLVEVSRKNLANNITDGIIRARFRDGIKHPSLLTPNTIYQYTIELWPTSHLFTKGNRMRLEISSSSFPRYDRNLNTGDKLFLGTKYITATQKIFHNAKYPSCIILPIVSD